MTNFTKQGNDILRYLKHFGECTFTEPIFNNGHVEFARIELIATEAVEEGLRAYLAEQLTPNGGYYATMKFIKWGVKEKNKYIYEGVVTPDETLVTKVQFEEVTSKYLQSLPRTLHQYANQRCRSKAKEINNKIQKERKQNNSHPKTF